MSLRVGDCCCGKGLVRKILLEKEGFCLSERQGEIMKRYRERDRRKRERERRERERERNFVLERVTDERERELIMNNNEED